MLQRRIFRAYPNAVWQGLARVLQHKYKLDGRKFAVVDDRVSLDEARARAELEEFPYADRVRMVRRILRTPGLKALLSDVSEGQPLYRATIIGEGESPLPFALPIRIDRLEAPVAPPRPGRANRAG